MAINKKSFILYSDLITVVEKLIQKDRENKTNYSGELFFHILQYVNDKEPIPIDFIVEMAFEPIKLQLKRDLKRYETIREKRSEAGKASAELRKQRSSNSTSVGFAQHRSTNSTVNDTDTVNDTVTVNVNDTDNSLLGAEAQKTSYDLPGSDSKPLEEEKEKDSAEKEKKFGKKEFRETLIQLGADAQHVEDWLKVRTAKRAVFTETVIKQFINECNTHSFPISEAVKICAEKSWQGFQYSWVQNLNKNGTGQTNTASQSRQARSDSVDELGRAAEAVLRFAGQNN